MTDHDPGRPERDDATYNGGSITFRGECVKDMSRGQLLYVIERLYGELQRDREQRARSDRVLGGIRRAAG